MISEEEIRKLIQNFRAFIDDKILGITTNQADILEDRIKILEMVIKGTSKTKPISTKEYLKPKEKTTKTRKKARDEEKKLKGKELMESAFKLFDEGFDYKEIAKKLKINPGYSSNLKSFWKKDREKKKEDERFEHDPTDFE